MKAVVALFAIVVASILAGSKGAEFALANQLPESPTAAGFAVLAILALIGLNNLILRARRMRVS